MFSNMALREAFQQLNETTVYTINAASAADFLFACHVLAASDYRKLLEIPSATERTRHLLTLLHTGNHPERFVKLREALCREPAYEWFVADIDARANNYSPDSQVSDSQVSEDGSEITGLALLGQELFVVRNPTQQKIFIYDSNTLSLKTQHLDVPGLGDTSYGFASCAKNTCLYVSSFWLAAVHKVKVDAATSRDGNNSRPDVTKWNTQDGGYTTGLSVTGNGNVLAVCWHKPDVIREFTTDGCLVRCVRIPEDILSPEHGIEMPDRHQFVISHGNHEHNTLHRVCILDNNGAYLHVYGHHPGVTLSSPRRLAVSKNGFILVPDMDNSRVLVVNSSLKSTQTVPQSLVARGFRRPCTLCLDESRDRLYVGEDSGRLVVINHLSSNVQM